MCPILGPLVPHFWISSDVSSGSIVEVNVMYIP